MTDAGLFIKSFRMIISVIVKLFRSSFNAGTLKTAKVGGKEISSLAKKIKVKSKKKYFVLLNSQN